ncbi:MFS transporter [Mariniflexile sp. AS56]|uniref:MFS transporter n=1 Tax=Mariniflexile sp. AS56 TaxID=3063957 RepID=UPI0026ECAC5B|nr:MFS transporter [Mariniflexile sp. AS56]MDO7172820.1 MFS transporter [Mariniflexile sp. AS56]
MNHSKHILPIIVFSQFCCTSLWFAGNAIMGDLVNTFNLGTSAMAHLTSAVQFGFIFGTFLFALLTITDRFSPSKVFLFSAIIAGVFNLGFVLKGHSLSSLVILRFLTGFFLAGIYPVGMKIASDYTEKGLGKSLGFLVGALVLGTAFPHVLKANMDMFPWKWVIYTTSFLSVLGGLLMFFLVPNGPYRKSARQLEISTLYKVFKLPKFRSAAFGYFGHMWELYTFWAFVPIMLVTYTEMHPETHFNVPVLSFIIIAVGGLACVVSGYVSQIYNTKNVAAVVLGVSGLCCLVSPLFFALNSEYLFIGFLVFWGMVVIADSPLFSTLVAQNCSSEAKGTALTIVNSIGFAVTIISIQLIGFFMNVIAVKFLFMLLAIGPVFGLVGLYGSSKH